MLEIRAPRIFAHAGVLPPESASEDPRDPDFEEDAVLIARESVDAVAPSFLGSIEEDDSPIALDFAGLGAVSPSAIDQFLVRIEEAFVGRDVHFSNMPFPSAGVHEAIARAHGRTLIENGPNSWTFAAR